MNTPQQQHALAIINRALLLSKVLPFSQINSASIDEKLDTWMVVGQVDKKGERIGQMQLVIGGETVALPPSLLSTIAIHESAHTTFTWFSPNGEYINDTLFSRIHNIFEDGRINKSIAKYYPQHATHIPDIYTHLDKGENDTPFISTQYQNPEEKKQIEWLNHALQLMLKENSTPGSGRLALSEWSSTKEEKIFLIKSLQYYEAYTGVSPQPTWGNSRNKALHATALQYLFGFDKMCGDVFSLPGRKLEDAATAVKLCQAAESAIEAASSRLTAGNRICAAQDERLKSDFEAAKTHIQSGLYTHRDIGICLAVIGLGTEQDSFKFKAETTHKEIRALASSIREAKGTASDSRLEELEELEHHLGCRNFTEMAQWAEEHKDNAQNTKIICQVTDLLEKIAALGRSRAMRLEDTPSKAQKTRTIRRCKGTGNKQNTQEEAQGFGIGHNSHVGEDVLATMPEYSPADNVRKEELPYWIDSGEIPRNNEPELLKTKPMRPGQSSGSNGTIEIETATIQAYERMIKQEFLSHYKKGERKFKEEDSKYFGRLDSREFLQHDLHEGRSHKRMFRLMEETENFSEAKGDHLAPKLILVLNDFSGSMHACSKELGAFSAAVFLLCQRKKTRLFIALGSHHTGTYDSIDPTKRIFGREGIVHTVEEKFNMDNGGNSPTWHTQTRKKVDEILSAYSPNPESVRVIIGSDEQILVKELEWLATIKQKYPTIVIKDIPDHLTIKHIGKFLRHTKK